MFNLLESEAFLLISLDILKILSWILGAYFLALGLIKFRKGWASQDKWGIFKANLILVLGLLFISFFLKTVLYGV